MCAKEKAAHLKVGVAGLGRAGGGILSSLRGVPGVDIVAAADPRANARALFVKEFGGRAHEEFDELCRDSDVDAIWIATPTHLHASHARLGAQHGKHLVVEKPFAVTLSECEQMIEVAGKNGVALIAGGSRSFDPAFASMRHVLASGRLGRLCALNTWSFTDWILRPREPYEVDVRQGGGAVYNQAPHPIDVLRLLGGGLVKSVRGTTLEWMPERPCPGYFTGFLEFDGGIPATFSYNGYGFLEAWELLPWGETDDRRTSSMASYEYRRGLRSGDVDEYAAREKRRYGGQVDARTQTSSTTWAPADAGLVVASCEHGEIRQSAKGLYVYDDEGRHDEEFTEPSSARSNEVAELRRAITGDGPVVHDGHWGMATMEVVIALIASGFKHREIRLRHQVAVPS